MNKRFPFPKRYWIYWIVVLICSILLIGNIYRTDGWTGDKPFSQFVQRDWQLLAIFLVEELIIASLLFLFVILACKISKRRNAEITEQWEKDKYLGINPGDYDYVWFDFANTERALILKQGEQFKLYVQEYDEHTGNWESFSGVSVYDSLETVKKALFYECDFYCEENAELDKHGDETFLEEIEISISSIQGVSREEISVFNTQCSVLEINFLNAHRCWCRKHRVNQSKPRYVCDKTNIDGERRMVFYANPRIVIVANKDQEDLWFKLIEKMKSVGCFAFDID